MPLEYISVKEPVQKRRKDVDLVAGFFVLWMINVLWGDWNWSTRSNWTGLENVPFMTLAKA